MKKKDKQNSVVAFGVHGWFHIIYMMLMFWFYVGMINDGSNNIAGKIAEHMLGSAKMAGTISTCNSIAGIIGVALFIVIGILNRGKSVPDICPVLTASSPASHISVY